MSEFPRKIGLASILLAAHVSIFVACAPEANSHRACPDTALPLPTAVQGEAIDETLLSSWVGLLADPARRGRRASTPQAHEVAGLLGLAIDRAELEKVEGGRCQSYPFLDGEDFNVIGHLLSTEQAPWVVVSAHYDGRGVAPAGAVLPGADDNASGVAALLEVMRLASQGPELGVSVAFVLFGAEEVGFVGSKTWLANPSLPLSEIEIVINLDMVGRRLPDGSQGIGYSLPAPKRPQLIQMLQRAASRSGVSLVDLERWHPPEKLFSDSSVLAEQVPALLLSTGLHADHHRPGDSADKIDASQIAKAVKLTLEILKTTPSLNDP